MTMIALPVPTQGLNVVTFLVAFACGTRALGGQEAGAVRQAGATRRDAAGVEQVWVPAGSFHMGSDSASLARIRAQGPPRWIARELPSESPDHVVRLSTGFWIDRFEVTNHSFAAFVAAGGYRDSSYWSDGGWAWLRHQDLSSLPVTCDDSLPDRPRACVTWYEAEAYAAWRGGRLPTEAEWEYAARGPQSSLYPWGEVWDETRCNVVESTGSISVGRFPTGASWVGALDMAGNVMEWVRDWLDPGYYAHAAPVDPTGPPAGRIKVEKGGWWGSNPFAARAAYRHFEDPPTYQDHHIGFRVMTPTRDVNRSNPHHP